MKKSLFFLLTIQLLLVFNIHAQGYYFRQYQVGDGLSHNTIYCTLQDSRGFMWFGTRDGLNRFDGVAFKVFRNDPADTSSLGNNFIRSLFEDNKKQLWIGTDRGLYKYDPDTEKFSCVSTPALSNVAQIQQDSNGIIWVLMNGNLYRYNEKARSLVQVENLPAETIFSICVDNNGAIWLGYIGSLRKYAGKGTITDYDIFGSSTSALVKLITVIYNCGNGKLLIGTSNHGLKLFDAVSGIYKDILTKNDDKTTIYVRSIMSASRKEYWVGTESGIFICNIENGSFIRLKKSYSNPYSLSDNAIYCFCKDREGNIWAGTFFGGINYVPKQYTPFQKYFPGSEPESLSGNAVSQISGDQYGDIWIGTEDNGLNRFNSQTKKIVHYLTGGNPGDISHSNIHAVVASGNDLWVSTFEHGLDRMSIITGKVIKHYDIGQNGSKSNFFVCIYQTSTEGILAGSTDGLLKFDSVKQLFYRVNEVPADNFIHHIMEDREGTIWVSTSNGLYYYNKQLGTNGNFRYRDSNLNRTNGNVVYSSFEDVDGNIWLGTESVGLCKIDKGTHTFSRHGDQKKWQSDCVFKILEDSSKNLWMSTTNGLVCFNPYNQSTLVFTRENGLLTDQFNFNSGYKDNTGRMYFGSVKGLISFHPKEFIKGEFIPPVYITSLRINNIEHSPSQQSIIVSREIDLDYNQSSFSIDFAALSFSTPKITEYAYKLDGLDHDWTSIKINRRVYFTNLSPGTYTFEVKASSSPGFWSAPAKIVINIRPPFWASTWAYLLYAITAIAVIYLTIRIFHTRSIERNRIRSVQMEHEKEKEFYQTKIDFFTTVAHEIKTPLTLIKGPLEKIIKKSAGVPEIQKSLATMEKNTNRLIQLTNQLLDFRQTEAKGFSLYFERINMSKMINEVFANFKPLADEKNISFSLSSRPDIYINADEDAMNKILGNLFSNAIKYAEHIVHIEMSQDMPGHIVIEFTNDGYIIPLNEKEKIFEPFYRLKDGRKQEGSGIGLALSRSLTELHRGHLSLSSKNAETNTFILIIPDGAPQQERNNLSMLTEKYTV